MAGSAFGMIPPLNSLPAFGMTVAVFAALPDATALSATMAFSALFATPASFAILASWTAFNAAPAGPSANEATELIASHVMRAE
ncbi:hypothetical protein D3C72_1814560 [compost metagenome]